MDKFYDERHVVGKQEHERLVKENEELKAKLKYIKMAGIGNLLRVDKKLDKVEKHLCSTKTYQGLGGAEKAFFQAGIELVRKIVNDEWEKCENLCLMCDFSSTIIKYEAAFRKILNLKPKVIQSYKPYSLLDADLVRSIAKQALETTAAEEAITKAKKEFEKYEN